MNRRFLIGLALCAQALLSPRSALAQNAGGFQLDRYEPTLPGAWFLAVEHPWYSSTRYFAAGLTLDYGHNPLVLGTANPDGSNFQAQASVIEHQLVGHIDLAGSFLDRVNISATLPVTLFESGDSGAQQSAGVTAVSSPQLGDPRVGLMVRLWGQPDKSPFSIHVGGNIWFPIGATSSHSGDSEVRGLPKIYLAGLAADHIRWSATLGYLIRSGASIGQVGANGSSIGDEFQLGLAAQYTDHDRKWAIGPEFLLATTTASTPTAIGGTAFNNSFTSMELLASGHYMFIKALLLSVGAGLGILRDPGTPDARVILRLAYAPVRDNDRDHDGIEDAKDACPDVKGIATNDPATNGCPPDRDHDGIPDDQDLCPDVPKGDHPDPKRRGCPIGDKDGDGILDDVDQCIDVPAGEFPDPAKPGCPLPDRDKDGVLDVNDICPDVPKGDTPDPARLGCPLEKPKTDRDHDGIFDDVDQCPDVPAGLHPDPTKPGCPLPDSDGDGIPDVNDACPDKPGAPDPDPKKNGCPGLVLIKGGKIVIMAPVFFATNKDLILPRSFPVLTSVANAVKVETGIKRLAIEGHTDSVGKFAKNMDLSDRRAKSVMRWLIANGIAAERLESHGYGPTRPIAPNTTAAGKAANRRVDFVIVDPAPAADSQTAAPSAPPIVDTAPHGKGGKFKKAKGGGKKRHH